MTRDWQGAEREMQTPEMCWEDSYGLFPTQSRDKGLVNNAHSAQRHCFSLSPVPLLTCVSSRLTASLRLIRFSLLLRCSWSVEEVDGTVLGRRERHCISIIYGNVVNLAGKMLLELNVRGMMCLLLSEHVAPLTAKGQLSVLALL